MKVLLIEDDDKIKCVIQALFQVSKPEAKLRFTPSGVRGIVCVEEWHPDVVLLDLNLPDMDGFDVLKNIRRFSTVPVLILTVRGEENDIVRGLYLGADDYVVKPFKPMELMARVQTITRRQKTPEESLELSTGNLHFGSSIRQLYVGEKLIMLTVSEGRIIHRLMENAGNVVSHSSLARAVWGDDYPGAADALKVHIRRIRQKLEPSPNDPQIIKSEPGTGYLLTE